MRDRNRDRGRLVQGNRIQPCGGKKECRRKKGWDGGWNGGRGLSWEWGLTVDRDPVRLLPHHQPYTDEISSALRILSSFGTNGMSFGFRMSGPMDLKQEKAV